jgi:uncharacterized repeat protein (TIGR03847 family)
MNPSFDFDHPDQVIADAVGDPGQRVFFLQVQQDGEAVSFKCEKAQVAALAEHLAEMLHDLPPTDPAPDLTAIEPDDVEWTVGTLGLAYDRGEDRVVLVAQEVEEISETDELFDEEQEEPELPTIDLEGDTATARILLTRGQAAAFIEHAREVIGAGRDTCPICGRPMDPEGHVCPRSNGHRPAPAN